MSLSLDHSSVIPADAIIILSDVAQSVPARMRGTGSTEKERPALAGFYRGSQSARQSTSFRFSAELLPFSPLCSSYSTFCPSLSELMPARSRAEIWTKASFDPSSGAMKP